MVRIAYMVQCAWNKCTPSIIPSLCPSLPVFGGFHCDVFICIYALPSSSPLNILSFPPTHS
jgi:hypothetical protein